MDALITERMVKQRQRELLEEAARERLVGSNRPGPVGVVVRLLDALRVSRGRVHEPLGETAGASRPPSG